MSAISPTPQLMVDDIENSGTNRPAWRASKRDGIAVLALKDPAGSPRRSLCSQRPFFRTDGSSFAGRASDRLAAALCGFPHIAGGSRIGHMKPLPHAARHRATTRSRHGQVHRGVRHCAPWVFLRTAATAQLITPQFCGVSLGTLVEEIAAVGAT